MAVSCGLWELWACVNILGYRIFLNFLPTNLLLFFGFHVNESYTFQIPVTICYQLTRSARDAKVIEAEIKLYQRVTQKGRENVRKGKYVAKCKTLVCSLNLRMSQIMEFIIKGLTQIQHFYSSQRMVQY